MVIALILLGATACGREANRLERIRAQGVLRVATDPSFPPFEFVNAEGQIAGLDADLAEAVAEHLGVEVHFVTTGYDALYDALTADRADAVISGLYPDVSQSANFSFSTAYFQAGQVLVTPSASDVTGVEGLAGRVVGCVFGTEGHMAALHWEEMLRPAPTIVTVDDPGTVIELLTDGAADAVVTDHVSALIALKRQDDLRILAPALTDEPYAIAVRQQDQELLKAINAALDDLHDDGTLDRLVDRWMVP